MWVYTVAKELLRRGDLVTVYTFIRGPFADLLEDLGATVTQTPSGDYDAALVNHNTCLCMIQSLDIPKVYTSHGPTHRLEWMSPGADAYVAVSEEVAALWASNGYASTVIRNPVDLELYEPTTATTPKVLCLSKGAKAVEIVRDAADRLGWDFDHRHPSDNPGPSWEPMEAATHVVGVGRGVYEGLAAGKHVVCMDARGKDGRVMAEGVVTPDNIGTLVQRNCSGRTHGRHIGASDLADMLSLEMGTEWGREWAEEHVNAATQVDRYVEIVERVEAGKEGVAT